MQKKNFENVLYANENKNIGLYLTKNQFVEGILLDIQKNHVVLEVNKKIIYIAINQIQAISKNTKDLHIAKEITPHLVRNDLTDVLIALRYNWITLNSFGNPTLFGILSSIFEDHIILINNKELLYAPITHITDISSEISESDHSFLNKKEQRAIQRMYRFGISEGTFEVSDERLIVEPDRINVAENKMIADVTEPINKGKVDINAISFLLSQKVNALVNKQEVETIDNGFPEEITEPINMTALLDNTFSFQAEENPESISLDLVEAVANIVVIEEELSQVDDDIQTEEMEHINTAPLEENVVSPQIEEKLESLSLDLVEADANILVSEEELFQVDDEVHTEVTELINTDILEENVISSQFEDDQMIKEQNIVFSDEQLNFAQDPLKLKGKDVLLTAWSTMNNDQSTIALPKKTDLKRKLANPSENTMIINGNTGLNEHISLSNQINKISDLQDKLDILDEVSETSEKKNPLLNASVMSKKEVNEMLEQQYFALMNYAAVQISNAINFKQADNKFYFHPGVEGSSEKVRRFEMINGYPVYDSKHDTSALEKQYISLMRHATTMYRKLRR